MCQNGGTLDDVMCMCDCAGSFSGDNCESEYTVWNIQGMHVSWLLCTVSTICV